MLTSYKAKLKRALGASMALAGVALAMPARPAQAQNNLTGAGATFPYPLYSKWFDVYNKSTGVRINYQSVGSGAGITQLRNGTVDFGASDAPLNNDDLKKMPAPAVHIPTVAGAVAVAYNVPGAGNGLRLSGEVLSAIFLGQITRWNDAPITKLNPGKNLPASAITVAHRSDGSGTTYIFTHYLKAVSGPWASQVGAGKSVKWPVGLGGKGNAGVAAIIRQTPGTIGYVELAYALQNHINYAALRNKAGRFIMPSVTAVSSAAAASMGALKRDIRSSIVNAGGTGSYPISGFTYILTYKSQRDAARGRALTTFLTWAIGPGQAYAQKLMYAPLPKSIVTIDRRAIQSIR